MEQKGDKHTNRREKCLSTADGRSNGRVGVCGDRFGANIRGIQFITGDACLFDQALTGGNGLLLELGAQGGTVDQLVDSRCPTGTNHISHIRRLRKCNRC